MVHINMNRALKRILLLGAFVAALLMAVLFTASGSYAQDSGSQSGTINIQTKSTSDHTPVAGVKLSLYRIASGSALDDVTLTDDFKDCGVTVKDMTDDVANAVTTLDSFVEKNGTKALKTAVSDSSGQLSFTGLADGVYYIRQTNTEEEFLALGYWAEMESYLVMIPSIDEFGNAAYTRDCEPKCRVTKLSVDATEVTVEKHWLDNNDKLGYRPESLKVALYDGNTLKETVTLNAGNNWQYVWTNLASGREWSVREVAVPYGYKMSVAVEDTTFAISNTIRTDLPNNPPDTPSSPDSPSSSNPKSSNKTDSSTPSSTNPDSSNSSNSSSNSTKTTAASSTPRHTNPNSVITAVRNRLINPRTGDPTNLTIYGGLGLLCGAAVICLAIYRKKKRIK